MARDPRQLRDEASAATAAGKFKRALVAYLELERLEPRDAQWSKRAAECYRRIGKERDAIEAYTRAADRYAQGGFLVQAIAVCKLILQIDPANAEALRRIAAMNDQISTGPTRALGLAENNPALADSEAVAMLRRGKTSTQELSAPARARPPSSAPPFPAMSRTKSKPVTLSPGQGLESVSLKEEVPNAFERREASGVYVIPIDEDLDAIEERPSFPRIEVEDAEDIVDLEASAVDDATELELEDIEEIPLPEPRALGAAAARALAATPLFAELSPAALEALVEQLELVHLSPREVLFHEGDPGDALYVVVEGEVAALAEGPPRVEMQRLGPGAFIGEVALMTDQPRTATILSVGDAELLRIDRVTLSNVLANHGEVLAAVLRFVRDRLVDRWMRTSPLFRPFEPDQRALLASRFKFLEVEAGSVLLAAGARPDGLYIVLAGTFEVRRGGIAVAMLGPGELIGETALLANGAFKSQVIARGKSLALCLPAEDFRELIMTHPHLLEYVGEHAEHSRKLQIL
jgi:cAMP-dependent protein kinase regulator